MQLAKVEQDIAAGQQRVAAQELRVQELQLRGRDAQHAEELLATLRVTLVQWHVHRAEILRLIRRLTPS